MAILPIYNSFHPLMKKKSEPVTEMDENLKKLVQDMYDTMYGAENGVGLAAPQVGELKRVVTLDLLDGDGAVSNKPLTLINPVIEEFSDEDWEYQEGCLSVPTLYETLFRPKLIQVRYYDINMKEYVIEADELLSRAIQHEIDHLDGILFYERLTPLRRTLSKNKLKKIQRGKVAMNYPMILPDGTKI